MFSFRSAEHSAALAPATNLKDPFGTKDDILNEISDHKTFSVKYLGYTVIEAARSEAATAKAIKTIISTAKGITLTEARILHPIYPNKLFLFPATGKKFKRIELSISPEGIDMLDTVTGEPLLQLSTYEISHCSADAVHGNVFAFVGSQGENSDSSNDPLVCHAFLCQTPKIARKVTLSVARSFATAYQFWQDTVQREQFRLQRQHRKVLRTIEKPATFSHTMDMGNLLIDFTSERTAEICATDNRGLAQSSWVSFGDEAPISDENLKKNSI